MSLRADVSWYHEYKRVVSVSLFDSWLVYNRFQREVPFKKGKTGDRTAAIILLPKRKKNCQSHSQITEPHGQARHPHAARDSENHVTWVGKLLVQRNSLHFRVRSGSDLEQELRWIFFTKTHKRPFKLVALYYLVDRYLISVQFSFVKTVCCSCKWGLTFDLQRQQSWRCTSSVLPWRTKFLIKV